MMLLSCGFLPKERSVSSGQLRLAESRADEEETKHREVGGGLLALDSGLVNWSMLSLLLGDSHHALSIA